MLNKYLYQHDDKIPVVTVDVVSMLTVGVNVETVTIVTDGAVVVLSAMHT